MLQISSFKFRDPALNAVPIITFLMFLLTERATHGDTKLCGNFNIDSTHAPRVPLLFISYFLCLYDLTHFSAHVETTGTRYSHTKNYQGMSFDVKISYSMHSVVWCSYILNMPTHSLGGTGPPPGIVPPPGQNK